MEDPLTQLIQNARKGDVAASQMLWSRVYDEVREAAHRALNREYQPVSLQATEIAHEAYMRLAGQLDGPIESRSHLIAIVAQAIRRLLSIGLAREKRKNEWRSSENSSRRCLGSDSRWHTRTGTTGPSACGVANVNARHAKLVELRFFGGMTMEEAAETLQISLRTAAGDWAVAKAGCAVKWRPRDLDEPPFRTCTNAVLTGERDPGREATCLAQRPLPRSIAPRRSNRFAPA